MSRALARPPLSRLRALAARVEADEADVVAPGPLTVALVTHAMQGDVPAASDVADTFLRWALGPSWDRTAPRRALQPLGVNLILFLPDTLPHQLLALYWRAVADDDRDTIHRLAMHPAAGPPLFHLLLTQERTPPYGALVRRPAALRDPAIHAILRSRFAANRWASQRVAIAVVEPRAERRVVIARCLPLDPVGVLTAIQHWPAQVHPPLDADDLAPLLDPTLPLEARKLALSLFAAEPAERVAAVE